MSSDWVLADPFCTHAGPCEASNAACALVCVCVCFFQRPVTLSAAPSHPEHALALFQNCWLKTVLFRPQNNCLTLLESEGIKSSGWAAGKRSQPHGQERGNENETTSQNRGGRAPRPSNHRVDKEEAPGSKLALAASHVSKGWLCCCMVFFPHCTRQMSLFSNNIAPVSYTHLTLPTKA